MDDVIRFSEDGSICVVDDGYGNFRMANQSDMDDLDVGDDLTQDEIDSLDD